MIVLSANTKHNAKVAVQESILQQTTVKMNVTSTPATVAALRSAHVTFFQNVAQSAIDNGCSPSAFLQTLRDTYGVGLYG